MLRSLSIRNVVLIDRLDVEFEQGLGVLTGETGSGKSILLDALGLAIGARADSDLVREGTNQSSVSAEFDLSTDDPIHNLMAENGLEEEDRLILRRVLTSEGRSRAFINDQAVSIGLLRQFGESLVEIHGQFEAHGLLDVGTHLRFLDDFGGHTKERGAVVETFEAWRDARSAREEAEQTLKQLQAEEEDVRYAVQEIQKMDPQPGEDIRLAADRSILMHREQLMTAMNDSLAALADGQGVEGSLRAALQTLSSVADKAEGRLDPTIGALDRALIEAAEALSELEKLSGAIEQDDGHLEKIEERLFSLRALARKHQATIDNLPEVRTKLEAQLELLESNDSALEALRGGEREARDAYMSTAKKLTKARRKAAERLDGEVAKELEPLRMEGARFQTNLVPLEEEQWGGAGQETAVFEVQTNPNTPQGAIHKIASGGELARITLALKVVLANAYAPSTVIFDEIDTGIGGATAAAVGERLNSLAARHQLLVITHSPQVAARGDFHWRIEKRDVDGQNHTAIELLDDDGRTEEIARMLAGTELTDEARAAAGRLLAQGAVAENAA